MNRTLIDIDRLTTRERPRGQPLMRQNWGKLLFMHWPIKQELLRPLIPGTLEIDTFDGSAWIAIVPFTMWGISALPPFIPPVPGLNSMHELNVRSYVHMNGVPGVWFLSLDCNSTVAVLGARTFFFLPYFNARITLDQQEQTIEYSLKRTDEPYAEFQASWRVGETLGNTKPGSLEYFLTERYCLYCERKGEIYRARVYHEPWSLQQASLSSFDSTMIESHGLPTPGGNPLLHHAEKLCVDIWPPKAAE